MKKLTLLGIALILTYSLSSQDCRTLEVYLPTFQVNPNPNENFDLDITQFQSSTLIGKYEINEASYKVLSNAYYLEEETGSLLSLISSAVLCTNNAIDASFETSNYRKLFSYYYINKYYDYLIENHDIQTLCKASIFPVRINSEVIFETQLSAGYDAQAEEIVLSHSENNNYLGLASDLGYVLDGAVSYINYRINDGEESEIKKLKGATYDFLSLSYRTSLTGERDSVATHHGAPNYQDFKYNDALNCSDTKRDYTPRDYLVSYLMNLRSGLGTIKSERLLLLYMSNAEADIELIQEYAEGLLNEATNGTQKEFYTQEDLKIISRQNKMFFGPCLPEINLCNDIQLVGNANTIVFDNDPTTNTPIQSRQVFHLINGKFRLGYANDAIILLKGPVIGTEAEFCFEPETIDYNNLFAYITLRDLLDYTNNITIYKNILDQIKVDVAGSTNPIISAQDNTLIFGANPVFYDLAGDKYFVAMNYFFLLLDKTKPLLHNHYYPAGAARYLAKIYCNNSGSYFNYGGLPIVNTFQANISSYDQTSNFTDTEYLANLLELINRGTNFYQGLGTNKTNQLLFEAYKDANPNDSFITTVENLFDVAKNSDLISKSELCNLYQILNSFFQNNELNLSSSKDLFIKDNDLDTGEEPNTSNETIWESPWLWNRNSQDSETVHQDAIFKDYTDNIINVTVSNKGCGEHIQDNRLELYYSLSSTGLAWPEQWVNNTIDINGEQIIVGDKIGEIRLPKIEYNNEETFSFGWPALDPESLNQNTTHINILARIVAQDESLLNETNDILNNVRNSNNIAWRSMLIKK